MCAQEFHFIHKKIACYLSETTNWENCNFGCAFMGTSLNVFMGSLPTNYTTPYSQGLDPIEPTTKDFDTSMLHRVIIK